MSPAPASSPSPHDAELVARIRRGDAAAFELLFRGYHAELRAFAGRYVGSIAAAEDVVHDVFVAIWGRRHEWSVHGGLRAYLFSAVRNRAISVLRHDARERRWRADAARGAFRSDPVGDSACTSENEGARNLEREERARLVAEVLAALPERCRVAVTLRWQRQLSYAEIAEVMQISIKTVEIHLTRGAKALRARYRAAFPDG